MDQKAGAWDLSCLWFDRVHDFDLFYPDSTFLEESDEDSND